MPFIGRMGLGWSIVAFVDGEALRTCLGAFVGNIWAFCIADTSSGMGEELNGDLGLAIGMTRRLSSVVPLNCRLFAEVDSRGKDEGPVNLVGTGGIGGSGTLTDRTALFSGKALAASGTGEVEAFIETDG